MRLRYSGTEALTDGESATLVLPGPLSWWGWREMQLLRHEASLGSPRWHLDDLPRLVVLTVSSLSPWEGSVTIPEQNSELFPKKVRMKKTLSKAPVQYSLPLSQSRERRYNQWEVVRGTETKSEPGTDVLCSKAQTSS